MDPNNITAATELAVRALGGNTVVGKATSGRGVETMWRRCLSNKTALAMIFKLAQAAEKSWHRLRGHNQLPKVILGVKFNHGIEVVRSQAQAAAA
jgi:hypothetical protein